MDDQDWGRDWDQDPDRDQDRRRRQTALRHLAEESAPGNGYPHGWNDFQGDDWSVQRSRVASRQRPRRADWQDQQVRSRRRIQVVAVVALLLVNVAVVGTLGVVKGHWFARAGQTSPQPTATPGPIQPLLSIGTSAAETCPTGIAWSPDALKIAVAADGEQAQCDTADPGRTQAVIIYDARSGSQLKKISISSMFGQLKISQTHAFAGQPSWSPDGSKLVVPFDLLDTAGQHSGLLIVPVNKGTPRALIDTADTQLVRPIWNLTTGKLVAAQTQALPQALTYSWSADGSLQPAQAAPSAGSTAYTGSPVEKADDASFSRWRHGEIAPVLREGYVGAPFAWFHYDTGALWSPDGQYVAPDYSIETRLSEPAGRFPARLHPQDDACIEFAQPSTSTTTSLATTYCGQKALPYPDAAYSAVVAKARAGFQTKNASGGTVTGWIPVEVAWRPDGKVLATLLPADDFAAHTSSVRVTLYDTASGQVLTTLTQQVTQPRSQTNRPFYLGWSPTGQQLALVNNGDSQVIVWGASSLASLPPVVG